MGRLLGMIMLVLASVAGAAEAGAAVRGLLLLAHGAHSHAGHGHGGAPSPWNRNVEVLAADMDVKLPTDVAFGMADPWTIQEAIDRLEARGVDEIVAVPLFVSSHSPIIGNFQYILGLRDRLAETTSLRHLDRVSVRSRIAFTGAMDAHPLISGILLDRARAVAPDPRSTRVVLIGHGPNDEGENRRWLADLEAHAAYLRQVGGFRSTTVLTHRNDAWQEIKAAARAALRQARA